MSASNRLLAAGLAIGLAAGIYALPSGAGTAAAATEAAVASGAPGASGAGQAAPDAGPVAQATPAETESVAGESDPELVGQRDPYPGDPEKESALVAGEDARLNEVRTVASLSRWTDKPLTTPYRVALGSAYTLVLTERRSAYTLTDLLVLAPQTFVRQPDGSYLLSENIVVQSGATLNLSGPQQLTIRMASDENGFVSIVNYGGRLELLGSSKRPVIVTSWDDRAAKPDRVTSDGRAYLRSIGGSVVAQHAHIKDLGFWSGRTGGLSLTGTDRPTPGALDALGKQLTVRAEKERAAARDADPDATLPDSTGGVTLDKVLPAGELPIPVLDLDQPAYSYVSAALADVEITGNAFGVFVAGANGVDIRATTVTRSLIDGMVFHRYVTNAIIDRSTSSDNGGDGIVLARATTGTVLSEVIASGNARNGVSISGLPLATGPSATGTAIGSYGNNAIQNSRVEDNGRYGIEVIGGQNMSVSANRVLGNDMGIVVREGSAEATVVGNTVERAARQGIAIRDGVTQSLISGNVVRGGQSSVYVRDSGARVEHNTLTGATRHALTVVGEASSTVIDANVISGRGPSALDGSRASGLDLRGVDNNTAGWDDTTPWPVTLKRLAQPLTLLWIVLGLTVLLTAVRGLRSPNRVRNPYLDSEPLHRPDDVVLATPPRGGEA